MAQASLSEWLWCGHRQDGNWKFDVRKSGIEVTCTEDVRKSAPPSLLSADGALIKRSVAVGFVDAPAEPYALYTNGDDDDDPAPSGKISHFSHRTPRMTQHTHLTPATASVSAGLTRAARNSRRS